MKKLFGILAFITFVSLLLQHGNVRAEITVSHLTIDRIETNGQQVISVTAYYPTNSISRQIQINTGTNNWRGLQLSEQAFPSVKSQAGSQTNWTKWFINNTNSIGVQAFRLVDRVVTNPPPEIPET